MASGSHNSRRHIPLPSADEKLLDQCEVDVFRSGGPGGQHANTSDTAVRLRHRPSGITVVARDERSQQQNRQLALERLRERIRRHNYRKPKRKRTRVPKGSREKRLKNKAKRSRKKELRRKPRPEE